MRLEDTEAGTGFDVRRQGSKCGNDARKIRESKIILLINFEALRWMFSISLRCLAV